MREQNRNKNQEIEEILEQMDLSQPAPETEPMRQYWFMKKARELVKEQSEKLGRPLQYPLHPVFLLHMQPCS